ncbi:hypothetical protein [Marinobacter sp. V034]|uniref:hypothetical protein n=1 Tax=Marinobacter sp. V034 TaxID=3459610 RepID=UPI0040441A06
MRSKRNEKTVDEKFTDTLAKILSLAILASGILLVSYVNIFGRNISSDHHRWAEFGSFMGGTVGPVISFVALMALLMTIRIQNTALRVSKQEFIKANELAQKQAAHFENEAKISDIVESIRELEGELQIREHQTFLAYSSIEQKPIEVTLKQMMSKDSSLIASLWGASLAPEMRVSLEYRHKDLGKIFELLFEQIMALRHCQNTENRYRIFMQKYLEIFFHLSRISALPFDWKAPLDTESTETIKLYESAIRAHETQRNARTQRTS